MNASSRAARINSTRYVRLTFRKLRCIVCFIRIDGHKRLFCSIFHRNENIRRMEKLYWKMYAELQACLKEVEVELGFCQFHQHLIFFSFLASRELWAFEGRHDRVIFRLQYGIDMVFAQFYARTTAEWAATVAVIYLSIRNKEVEPARYRIVYTK